MNVDSVDAHLVERLQDGLEVTARPFAAVAHEVGVPEAEVLARIRALLEGGVLSRFGPMFDAERLGGAFCLCAMAVPETRFDQVASLVNAYPEVAHNYRRAHPLNLWFVLATETPETIRRVNREIEQRTGLEVLDLPKEHEYYVGLRLAVRERATPTLEEANR